MERSTAQVKRKMPDIFETAEVTSESSWKFDVESFSKSKETKIKNSLHSQWTNEWKETESKPVQYVYIAKGIKARAVHCEIK